MIQNEILKALESSSLEETLRRVEALLEQEKDPQALPLGILLALTIALELQEGKMAGTDSQKVISQWVGRHSEQKVNEAVEFARQFLLKPQDLSRTIGTKIRQMGAEQSGVEEDL